MIFRSKKNFGQKFFGPTNFLGSKEFWVKKKSGQKNYDKKIQVQMIWTPKKIFMSKRKRWVKIVLGCCNLVNIGGGGDDPPQKIVGIKLC